VCEVVTDLLEVVLAQHLRFALVGTPRHAGILQRSLFVRHAVERQSESAGKAESVACAEDAYARTLAIPIG
jgi:hypothetical protein